MTSTHLHRSVQTAVTLLQQVRAEADLKDVDLIDSPKLRRDAQRFAKTLAKVTDASDLKLALMEDHAGAESFWFLLRTHWEEMETFLLPSAFELLPEPRPFEILSRCESWFDLMVPIADAAPIEAPLTPLAETDSPELEWGHHLPTAEMPGIPRPVREALSSPLLAATPDNVESLLAMGAMEEDARSHIPAGVTL